MLPTKPSDIHTSVNNSQPLSPGQTLAHGELVRHGRRNNPYISEVMTVHMNYDEVASSLRVEQFSKWKPSPSARDRTELVACPAVRNGLPFEPIGQNPRRSRARRAAAADGESR